MEQNQEDPSSNANNNNNKRPYVVFSEDSDDMNIPIEHKSDSSRGKYKYFIIEEHKGEERIHDFFLFSPDYGNHHKNILNNFFQVQNSTTISIIPRINAKEPGGDNHMTLLRSLLPRSYRDRFRDLHDLAKDLISRNKEYAPFDSFAYYFGFLWESTEEIKKQYEFLNPQYAHFWHFVYTHMYIYYTYAGGFPDIAQDKFNEIINTARDYINNNVPWFAGPFFVYFPIFIAIRDPPDMVLDINNPVFTPSPKFTYVLENIYQFQLLGSCIHVVTVWMYFRIQCNQKKFGKGNSNLNFVSKKGFSDMLREIAKFIYSNNEKLNNNNNQDSKWEGIVQSFINHIRLCVIIIQLYRDKKKNQEYSYRLAESFMYMAILAVVMQVWHKEILSKSDVFWHNIDVWRPRWFSICDEILEEVLSRMFGDSHLFSENELKTWFEIGREIQKNQFITFTEHLLCNSTLTLISDDLAHTEKKQRT